MVNTQIRAHWHLDHITQSLHWLSGVPLVNSILDSLTVFQAVGPDYCNRECLIFHLGNNIGIVWWGWGCQRAHICLLTMLHVSHPYLVSFSFYTLPICLILKIRRIFNLLVSTHFYILLRISLWKGASPLYCKKYPLFTNMWLPWKWCNKHVYQVSSPFVVPLASLKNEEVNSWSYLLFKQYVVVMEAMQYVCVPSSSPYMLVCRVKK